MSELRITIRLVEPLQINAARPGAAAHGVRHIGGAMTRGAVGAALARAGRHSEHAPQVAAGCPFCEVFLAGPPPRFGPCYPVGSDTSDSRPLPATARECKEHPGMVQEDGHGLRDILLRQWAAELAFDSSGVLPAGYPFLCHVNGCEAGLEAAGAGVYESDGIDLFRPSVWLQRFSRVAIDRYRHVAAPGLLYTLEVIGERMNSGRRGRDGQPDAPAPAIFTGRVWAGSGVDVLARALEAIDCLGGDTSRGLGRVAVTVDPVAAAPRPAAARIESLAAAVRAGDFRAYDKKQDLIGRIGRFNKALRQAAQDAAAPVPPECLYFTVDLLAEAVCYDDGLPSATLPAALAGARRERAWTSAHSQGGWHVAAGLPRRTYLALAAGGVALYRLERGGDPAVLGQAVKALADLEAQGLGHERERGYGWIEICSPFHLEVKPR
jgi:CRISPR-associated Csx10 family RAMP protein